MTDSTVQLLARQASLSGLAVDEGRWLQAALPGLPEWRWACGMCRHVTRGSPIARDCCQGTGYAALSPKDRVRWLAAVGHVGARTLAECVCRRGGKRGPLHDVGCPLTAQPKKYLPGWDMDPFDAWLTVLPPTLQACAAEGATRLALPRWIAQDNERPEGYGAGWAVGQGARNVRHRWAAEALDAARAYLLDPTPERREACGKLLMPEGTTDDTWWRCPAVLICGGPDPARVLTHLFTECARLTSPAKAQEAARARCRDYLLGKIRECYD